MTIYQHRKTITASSGSTSTTTLKVVGGLCRQFIVAANTSTTVFQVNVTDYKNLRVLDYGYHTGTLNDQQMFVPMDGEYSINITNASPDDTFSVYIGVQE